MMKILSNTIDDVRVFELSGRFDAKSAPDVQRELQASLEQDGRRIIVNMANVDFVDSTALSTLVQTRRSAGEKQGDLYLCELRQPVRIIFELTRLDRVFEIYPDLPSALMAFSVGAVH